MSLKVVVSSKTDPFTNIAVENYLLAQPERNSVTLYLWKNSRTVVIGQNQNPYAECDVNLLESEGGHLMRRRSGGGAVYHDDGNLNFSFIVPHARYDQQRQFSVLQKAVESFGLRTELSGRNDVLCYDADNNLRKFSGNAFNKGRYQHLHHGTILINGNMNDMQRYLKVNPSKLQKHGVESVRSRVVNLAELAPITSEIMVPHLISAFSEVYGESVIMMSFDCLLLLPEVDKMISNFRSDEWRFGRWRNFTAQRSAQFEWGLVDLSLYIDEQQAKILEVDIATDCLQVDEIDKAKQLLTGASSQQPPTITTDSPILRDIISMIY